MKSKILKLVIMLLIIAGSSSCTNDAAIYDDAPYYILCDKTEGDYLNMIRLQGNGYLFLNSVPVELEHQNNVAFVVYFPEQDSAVFKLSNPDHYEADICNFPDYAKHWEIPLMEKTE